MINLLITMVVHPAWLRAFSSAGIAQGVAPWAIFRMGIAGIGA